MNRFQSDFNRIFSKTDKNNQLYEEIFDLEISDLLFDLSNNDLTLATQLLSSIGVNCEKGGSK